MDEDTASSTTSRHSGGFINFLRAPIWGLTGRLSLRQSHEAEAAKDARLARTGEVENDGERHVKEGHADRRDLLGWATDVTSKGREERREVVRIMERAPSPLKRRTARDFEELWARENEIARRRTVDAESEMIFERAMERSRIKREREKESQRKEKERLEELWRPRNVTVRDRGSGTPGMQAPDGGERHRDESEERTLGDEVGNNEEVRGGVVGPLGRSKAEMEGRETPFKDVKEEVENLATKPCMEAEIRDIKGSESILDVHEQERNAAVEAVEEQRRMEEHTVKAINETRDIEDHAAVAAAEEVRRVQEHTVRAINETRDIEDHAAVEAAEKQSGVEEPTVGAINEIQDNEDARNEANTAENEDVGGVQPPSPLNIPSEVPSQQLQTEGQTQQKSTPADKWAQGIEGPAARSSNDVSPKTVKIGEATITNLSDSSNNLDISVSAHEIAPSTAPSPPLKYQDFPPSTSAQDRTVDDISPKSQPAGATIKKPLEISDSVTGQDDLGQVVGVVREKWGMGREGEEARACGGVSPKSGGRGSAVVSVASKEDGCFDGEEAAKEVTEQTAAQASAQRRTEKWVQGEEGEKARQEGSVSAKSRVGSVGMDGAPFGTASENGSVSMKSAKSHISRED